MFSFAFLIILMFMAPFSQKAKTDSAKLCEKAKTDSAKREHHLLSWLYNLLKNNNIGRTIWAENSRYGASRILFPKSDQSLMRKY